MKFVLLWSVLACTIARFGSATEEGLLDELDKELLFDILQENHLSKENDQNECANKSNGDYPDKADCAKYITCSNGLAIADRNCPKGLYFNPKQSRCDYPSKVDCKSKKDDCSGKADGNYPDPKNCYGFISCSNGIPYLMNCPSGLKFNKKKNQCDDPSNVVCSANNDVKYDNDEDGPLPSKDPFCKNKANGNYVNPFECRGFIMCSNHLTYFFDCPSILEYNPKTDQCDWPRNVKCGPTPKPTTKPLPPTPSPSGFCKNRPNGNYADPANCNGFIMCSNHLTYFFKCPAKLRYNAKTDRCDWPRNVKCGPTPKPTTKPLPPTPSPSGFCKNRPNGNYADPANCNGFIMCSNHLTYFFNCPSILEYNPETDQCDWPWNVQCGSTPEPTTRPLPPTPSQSVFCKNRPNGNYADPKNCNRFISCSNHLTYYMDCPAKLRYNAKTDRCDWPRNVKCSITTLSDALGESSRINKNPFCVLHGNGNYRDITNCEGYFTCYKGYQIFRECPRRERFNPETKKCDLPRNVKCGGAGGGTRGSHFCRKRRNGDYRDVLNCNGFIKCSNSYTYYFDCPSILRFNWRTDRCDWPRNVRCRYMM